MQMELGFWYVRLCAFLSSRLPLRLCYTLAVVVADVVYALCPRLREDTKSSIAHVLGQTKTSRDVSRVTRKCLRNYAKSVMELFRYSRRPAELGDRVILEGLDRLDAALSEGKGVIIAGLHLGSWDVGGTFLAQRYYPLNAIVRSSFNSDKLSRFMQDMRREVGIAVISAQGGIRHAAQVLRRNELLALLVDAPNKGKLAKVRFLQDYAQFSTGVATLAIRTKAAVLPGYIVRLPDNTFKGSIGEKIEFQFSGDFRRDIQHFTQSLVNSLQGFVKQYPEQWGMLRKIWCE